jgi:hypothetical protein
MALAKSLTSTCTGYTIVYGIDYVIGQTIEKVKMLSLNVLLHWVCARCARYTIVFVFGYMVSYALIAPFAMPLAIPLAMPLSMPLAMQLAVPLAMPSAMTPAMP